MKIAALFVMLFATAAFAAPSRLVAPEGRHLRVAFVLTEGATMIDFAGPWEVFQDVHVHDRGKTMDEMMPFELYTVGASRTPIHTSGNGRPGMSVTPDYTFADAPTPDVVVVGAQHGADGLSGWLQRLDSKTVIMSVCTGAFKLGAAGLLDGKEATTHHEYYDAFQERNPKVKVVRSKRFVQSDARIFTAGGLSSGIDLALHVVALYFGDEVASSTASYMEYEGSGWRSGAAK